MNRCLIAHAMGAAAGGLLGFALLPMAVAFADEYAIAPDPSSIEEVTGIYGSEINRRFRSCPEPLRVRSFLTLTIRPSVVPQARMSSGRSMPTRLPLRAATVMRKSSLPPTFQAP